MTERDKQSEPASSVVIIDDHPLIRRGLAETIEDRPEWRIAGEADSVDAGLALIEETKPDLALVDISLGASSGLDLIQRLRVEHPDVKALVVSMHDDRLYAERALRSGAKGYICKSRPAGELLEALAKVRDGQTALSDEMTERLLQRSVGGSDREQSGVESLSDRELQVFQLIGSGLGTKEIAEQLCLSAKTIETHRQNIKAKLNLASGNELIRQATLWVEDLN